MRGMRSPQGAGNCRQRKAACRWQRIVSAGWMAAVRLRPPRAGAGRDRAGVSTQMYRRVAWLRLAGHDAVAGAAGPGAAGSGALAAQDLRGGPAVQFPIRSSSEPPRSGPVWLK